ncbi:GNAT family N-acetyltransferase [Hymenobacter sp. BT683]|uniref:GNAT family N-acetyltransferase n=1 Tax=Hymenobacter jeongseonensis TaxID=2791027 RepID=A0ABS0IGC1_9BACT|nr:GNAT family N-acetyltransferase [Hymenobacter jeongseonensis]MBF9237385.1 GNAT family N-acetyltransferase [Hymenobacter jeongseonensis]
MQRPPFPHHPALSDDTILLRQIAPHEVSQLIDISFYDAKQATTVDQAASMLARIAEDYRAGNTIHWGIEDKATHRLVGTCGYYRGFEKERGELGCVLLEPFRGQGYMAKALKLVIEFGKSELALKAIVAITSRQNRPAIRLMEGLAFREAATLPDGYVEYIYPLETI